MIVDINMHWLPENLFKDKALLDSFIRIVPRAYGEYAKVTTVPETGVVQITISKPKGYENLNFSNDVTDTKGRLEAMDEIKVDRGLLRIPCWQEWLNLEMCKMLNDMMAKYIKDNPGRFFGIAVVPPWGEKESFHEMERCIKELGFVAVEVAAHYGNLYLDEEEFRPFFKKISELGVPACVHHTPLPVSYEDLLEYPNLRRLYGRCVGQMTTLGRLLFSGLFDEYPNLRVVHTMMAGGFFAYANLLAPQKSGVREEMERFDTGAGDKLWGYLKRNVYFDITHAPIWGKPQLECAVKVLGADHVLFGSSYPLRREWLLKGVDYVKSLEISEKEKSMIMGENAVKLFNLKI